MKFKKPAQFDYNLVTIGAGAAGLVSCYIGAAIKAKTALIEEHKMGGDCLNTGCVPSKALIRSAKFFADAKRARSLGLRSVEIDFDFGEIMERVARVIKKIEPHDSVERYASMGVECVQGRAKIVSPWEIEVNGRRLTTRNICVATGAGPLVPPIPGLEKMSYRTTDDIWELRSLPKNLLVLGGGPIGCELAQCFQRFGSQVTLVEKAPRILIREDDDVSEFVIKRFKDEGMTLLTGHEAREFVLENGKKHLVCEFQGAQKRIEFDEVLVALGRKARVSGFGLEEMGIETTQRGTLKVDEFLRTTRFSNIYGCGDVVGPFQFTHVAAHQAWHVAVNALFAPFKKFKVDYRVIPWATYTDPEVARVGLSEKEAVEQNIPHEVTRYDLDDLDRAIADEEDHGLVKVLTSPGKDAILGATIVGSHAGDIIAEYVAAMKHGFGLNKILGTIHIYPTLGEATKMAAGNWKKAHAPQGTLRFLEKYHGWRRS